MDPDRDLLYLDAFGDEVEVYENASTLHGAVEWDHRIIGMSSSHGLVLDATRDRLYTMNAGGSDICVLQNASTVTTGLQSTIALPSTTYLQALAVDGAHDRLYAGAPDAAFVIDDVSTRPAGAASAAKVAATGNLATAFAFAPDTSGCAGSARRSCHCCTPNAAVTPAAPMATAARKATSGVFMGSLSVRSRRGRPRTRSRSRRR